MYAMLSLECHTSKTVNSDTCPRSTAPGCSNLRMMSALPLRTGPGTHPPYVLGAQRASYFYFSSAIDIGLPHRIGALGVSLLASLLLVLGFFRFLLLRLLLGRLGPSGGGGQRGGGWSRLNAIALGCSAASAFGLLGIAAFNVSFDMTVHLSFAAACFLGQLAAISLYTHLDKQLGDASTQTVRVRQGLVGAAVLNCCGFGAMIKLNPLEPQAPASACELATLACIFLYYFTWLPEFRRLQLTVRAEYPS